MKNMQNFAAQQLTKRQMNDINGGRGISECMGKEYNIECTIEDNDGIQRRIYGCGETNGNAILDVARVAIRFGASIGNKNCQFF